MLLGLIALGVIWIIMRSGGETPFALESSMKYWLDHLPSGNQERAITSALSFDITR
jgi:hypothetical protein